MANKRTDRMRTPEARCAFVNVFTPREAMQAGREPKYGVTLLLPKAGEDISFLKAAAKKLGEDEFGPNFWEGAKAKRYKWPFRDGDAEKSDRPEFAGMTFLSATTKMKPQVFDGRIQPITDPEEFGSGDYAKVLLNFFAFNQAGNAGIAAGLIALQRTRKGERLGGINAASEFDVDESVPEGAASVASEFDI